MNSSSTTNQHAVPTVGEGMGAVQHDYNDPSVCSSLYVTSIRAAPLADGREINVAVVKVDGLHPSSPSQHFADLYMLQENTDERCVALFRSSDGGYKPVMQIEVDGGADEDPSRAETQCLLAELMLGGPKRRPEMRRRQVAASTRCSHSSPLNKVERLNGQETRGAAGFVAMTNACGSLLDASTGDLDKAKVHAMWRHHQERLRESLSEISGLGGASILAVKGAELGAEQLCEEATIVLERARHSSPST